MKEKILSKLAKGLKKELTENLMPFWLDTAFDRTNKKLVYALFNDMTVDRDVPISFVMISRLLWSYSAVYRYSKDERFLNAAEEIYRIIINYFWDHVYSGFYWSVDQHYEVVDFRKHQYAQSFALYSLSEYILASADSNAMSLCKRLFDLLENKAYDHLHGGYIESFNRQWMPLENMRLSERDLNCPKSMNTMLHMLEAFSVFRLADQNQRVANRHETLLKLLLERIYERQSRHLLLFFELDWKPISRMISFAHDIEASWLMWEAAELTGNSTIIEITRKAALEIAEEVLNHGMDQKGFIYTDADPDGKSIDKVISWWPQVEGIVGFLNAFQISRNMKFLNAAENIWDFTHQNFIDKEHGDWFKQLHMDGSPNNAVYKIGPWEGSYHHIRGCLETIKRCEQLLEE